MTKSGILLASVCIVILLFGTTLSAQYKMSSHSKPVEVEIDENQAQATATTTVRNFFEFAAKGDRKNWESLLSKTCTSDSSSLASINNWYSILNKSGKNYSILREGNARRSNQKIYLVDSGISSSGEKQVILTKEKGEWKVLYAKL